MRVLLLPSLLTIACAPADAPTDPDAAMEDALTACLAEVDPERTFSPSSPARGTRIHARAAVDASGAWLTWNDVDDTNTFDVWVAHVGCDGSTDVAPVRVSEVAGNAIDSAIAVRDDRVLVAWQSDDGSGGEDNLSVRWRLIDLAGAPQGGVQELAADRSAWMPDVAATPTGWVLVGSRATETTFRVFRLDLDPAGAAQGDPVDLGRGGDDAFELSPDVAVDANGGVWVAFDDQRDAGREAVLVAPDGSVQAWAGANPRVSAWGDQTWAAFAREDGQIAVVPPGGTPVAVPAGRLPDVAADVAAGPDGASLLVLANERGNANRVRVVHVDAAGAVTGKQSLSPEPAPPYPPHLDRASADTVIAVWQEGTSPAFELKARWVVATPGG